MSNTYKVIIHRKDGFAPDLELNGRTIFYNDLSTATKDARTELTRLGSDAWFAEICPEPGGPTIEVVRRLTN